MNGVFWTAMTVGLIVLGGGACAMLLSGLIVGVAQLGRRVLRRARTSLYPATQR